MFIRKLEIFGFKSFKNKTVLEFENHEITGIVGPNGCGKSNVVDALLWVMGENSPKNLRGESLSDVIFGGTTKESPGHLAEVTLTLERGKEGFPENYQKFSELMITRRAYRDGKNEYLINQQACLLRDIREFFMNTGAGCRGFSIIEQEAIERLITAKPVQRRFIIEEVAGITKFKNRKTESVRKLDLVQQNLQRINDILKNQELQLNQLSRQAKTAEKYKKIKKEIEDRQRQIEKREQEDVFCAYQNLIAEQENVNEEQAKNKEKNESVQKQIVEAKANIKTIEEQIQKVKNDLESERQLEISEKMEEASLVNRVKAFEMIGQTKNKKKMLKEKEQEIQTHLLEMKDFFKDKSNIENLEKEVAQVKNHLDELQHNKREAELNAAGIKKQLDFIENAMKTLEEEKADIQSGIQNYINEKNNTSALLTKHTKRNITLSHSLSGVLEQEEQFESARKNLELEFQNLKQRQALLRDKSGEMKKLIARFKHGNEGALDLIQWREGEFQSLFEKLEVDSAYAMALGVALGHYIQAVIPKEDASIEEAVQRLKKDQKGRTSFLSGLPGLAVSPSLRQELRNYPALDCFLDEKVKWNSSTQALQPYLEQTAVVSDLSSALKLKRKFPAFQFVTKEGDLITRDSFVYAGSSDRETGLLEIQVQIEDCAKELSSVETELKVKMMDLKSCEKRFEAVQQEKQRLHEEDKKNSEAIISIKKDLERIEKDIVRLSDSRQNADQKTARLGAEKQNLEEHGEAYNKDSKELDKIISLKKSRLQVLEGEMDEYKAQDLRRMEYERELGENRKLQDSLDQEVTLLLNLIGKSKDSEEDENQAFNMEEEIRNVRERKEKISARLHSLQQSLNQQNQLKEKEDQSITDSTEQLHQIQLDSKGLELEWDKKEMEKNHLRDRFLEKYQLEIENFVSSSDETSLEQLKEEMSQYERQLERMGGVNFLALEDYEKLSKENFFLNEQKEDLVHSQKEILKVISHIDKLCKTRFVDMLEEINKRFEKIFPIVFQGDNAKAQLILHEGAEDKEPGVDILIHPPGKRPQSVSLLSRGEKALTSICLIYSLFLVKPSPFCIIDEADAPLDDNNIFRFLSVLKEMSRKSQLIVITHNKYTMQSCRKLYGVTTEQPGVSQIVSVDMKKPQALSANPQ